MSRASQRASSMQRFNPAHLIWRLRVRSTLSDGFRDPKSQKDETREELMDTLGLGSHFSYLWRCTGSALPRTILPALLSAGLTALVQEAFENDYIRDLFVHPYPFQVFAYVAAFALVFRTQISYARFWEARTQCAQMSGKWADGVLEALSFDQVCKLPPLPSQSPGVRATGPQDEATKAYRAAIKKRKCFQAMLVHRFSLLHALAVQQLRRDHNLNNLKPVIGKNASVLTRFEAARTRQMETAQARKLRAGRHPPLRVIGGLTPWQASRLEPCPDRVGMLISMALETMNERRAEGGLGVEAPVLSRVYQAITDGTIGFNQARKITYQPFPFAYAQIVTVSLYLLLIAFPVVAASKIGAQDDYRWAAPCLSFITAVVYLGLHEVAIQLEEPYKAPGDLPLVLLQDEFNERLLTCLRTLGSQAAGVGQDEMKSVLHDHWPRTAPLEALHGGSDPRDSECSEARSPSRSRRSRTSRTSRPSPPPRPDPEPRGPDPRATAILHGMRKQKPVPLSAQSVQIDTDSYPV